MELLLTSAATDFNTHRPPFPDRVRDVRIGYAATPEGTRRYMLCGSFLPQGATTGWAPFVTIKTSGYEQWLGAQASVYCGAPSVVWVAGDFTAALQGRLDSLR